MSGQTAGLRLSICITTFNRAVLIGETLESILFQLTNDCEVLVLDGGSTDNTEQVLLRYMSRCARLRYVRQERNSGFDRDCDRAVELARGEYCWLMTDDDLLKPAALGAVLRALSRNFSLIIVNMESRDFHMTKVLQTRWLGFDEDRVYRSDEMDRLFVEVAHFLKYVGSIIIKRSIWLARERQRYFDSFFVYFGVIFQERLPGEALVIAEPLICHRMGNTHVFSPRICEIQLSKWPSLVASSALSETARKKAYSAEPWKNFRGLLMFRAMGWYSLAEYRRWVHPRLSSIRERLMPVLVALLPGSLLNAFFVMYCSITRKAYLGLWQRGWMLQRLRESRFHLRNLRRS